MDRNLQPSKDTYRTVDRSFIKPCCSFAIQSRSLHGQSVVFVAFANFRATRGKLDRDIILTIRVYVFVNVNIALLPQKWKKILLETIDCFTYFLIGSAYLE